MDCGNVLDSHNSSKVVLFGNKKLLGYEHFSDQASVTEYHLPHTFSSATFFFTSCPDGKFSVHSLPGWSSGKASA